MVRVAPIYDNTHLTFKVYRKKFITFATKFFNMEFTAQQIKFTDKVYSSRGSILAELYM